MGLFGKDSEKTDSGTSGDSGKIELHLNLSDLEFISIVKLPEEIKKRISDARVMLKEKAMEVCGVAPGSDKFKEIVRMQTLVSTDPKTAELIYQAKQSYRCVYGLKVNMSFTKKEIEEIIESSKPVCGPWADDMRRKLSDAINK